MSMTLVWSGPTATQAQAAAALRSVGVTLDDSAEPHGHVAADGHTFLTGTDIDVDRGTAAVEALGWSLRSHWETSTPIIDAAAQQVQDLTEKLGRLEAAVRAAGIEL